MTPRAQQVAYVLALLTLLAALAFGIAHSSSDKHRSQSVNEGRS